jgi:hypothetical protein
VGASRASGLHVAEQVSIAQPPAVVVAMLGRRPSGWLLPFLLLAWNEGVGAMQRLDQACGRSGHAPRGGHLLRLGRPVCDGGRTTVALTWTVAPPSPTTPTLFRRLHGELVVEAFEPGTVLGVRASYLPSGDTAARLERLGGGTAQRPVELAVRSLLGHLRTAVE